MTLPDSAAPRLASRMADIEPFHVVDLITRAKALEAQGRTIVNMVVGEPDESFTLTVYYDIAPIHSGGTIRLRGGEERTLDPWLVTVDVPTRQAPWTIDATLIAPDRTLPEGTTVML